MRLFILFFFVNSFILFAQTPISVVKGVVVDYQTRQPIPGATCLIEGTKLGTVSKSDGSFKIEKVPVGRHVLKISSISYETYRQHIAVTSGREIQLEVLMKESYIQMEEVVVTAESSSFSPINEVNIVSSNRFTVDDVERYAGSRMDPARMAQNFAGVVGANDQRNDIIIRGGSPTELLWRLDGLDIPNPNHFATQGATGGPISAINSTILSNSDFLTGAFPAEYGDRISGVFDLHTRKGNKDNYEFMGQFGFNGFELGAEGPMNFWKSSFIANYRYSFLELMDKMGFEFGVSGLPRYQDGTVKLDFQPNEKNNISITGLYGISDIKILESETDDVATGDRDITNGTDFVSVGLNWQHLVNDKSYGRFIIGTVYNNYSNELDSITTNDNGEVISIDPNLTSKSIEAYHTAKYEFNYTPIKNHFFTIAAESRFRYYDMRNNQLNPDYNKPWQVQETDNAMQYLGYINWNWRALESLTINAGVFTQHLEINKQTSLEPRLALKWQIHNRHSINAGFGVHRQSLPLLLYFTEDGNEDLDFIQSTHYVAGYEYLLSSDAQIKIEAYYKDISNAPVERNDESSYSFLNAGAGYGVVEGIGMALKSTGKGKAYGMDLSFYKHFSDHYYITATGSYIRQEYAGSDGIWRFGAFDNIFVANLLAGYELVISPTFSLEFSGKYTIAGGTPYTPIDFEESALRNGTYYDEENAYSERKPNYSRFDIRIDFRQNLEKISIISYISAENMFNQENILTYQYNKRNNSRKEIYQMGFFFVGGVRIEF